MLEGFAGHPTNEMPPCDTYSTPSSGHNGKYLAILHVDVEKLSLHLSVARENLKIRWSCFLARFSDLLFWNKN